MDTENQKNDTIKKGIRRFSYMKRIVIIIAVALLCGTAQAQENQQSRLKKHLYTLAADSLRGREAGTEDGHRAANYIIAQWQQMGLRPFFGDSYRMPFTVSSYDNSVQFCNLVAVIEGNDPVLKNEYIVVGAHYDHVGVTDGQIYNGADDNASGSSCVIEVARQLLACQSQLRRSVIICAFDAEEKGLYGSTEFQQVLANKNMMDKVKLMLSVDMVGWYRANGELILEGSKTVKDAKGMFAPEKLGASIKVRFKSFETSAFTATDTEPFAKAGIPTLAVSTGLKSPYHKPGDDAELIDYEGLNDITDYLAALVVTASNRDGKLATGRLAYKHQLRRFEAAAIVGFNTSRLHFPEATFKGKSHTGFQGGISLQLNLGKSNNTYLSLRANALYDYTHCPLPLSNDAYGKGYNVELHSLLVPTTLQLNIMEGGTGVYFGLGFYYQHVFDGCFYGPQSYEAPAFDVKKNTGGFVWDLGLRLAGRWQLDCAWYYQTPDLFGPSELLPKAKVHTFALTLGYYF